MMAEVSFETKRNPERCEAYRCQHSTKGMYKGQLEALPRPARPSVTEASAPCRASRNLSDRS